MACLARIEGGRLPRSAVPRLARVHGRHAGRVAPQGVRGAVPYAWRPSDCQPQWAVSVFGSAGGGYARYSESKERVNGTPNPSQRDTNTGALQIGGGVDVRALRWLAFSGEVRDVFTGARNFSIVTPHDDVHNVVVSV